MQRLAVQAVKRYVYEAPFANCRDFDAFAYTLQRIMSHMSGGKKNAILSRKDVELLTMLSDYARENDDFFEVKPFSFQWEQWSEIFVIILRVVVRDIARGSGVISEEWKNALLWTNKGLLQVVAGMDREQFKEEKRQLLERAEKLGLNEKKRILDHVAESYTIERELAKYAIVDEIYDFLKVLPFERVEFSAPGSPEIVADVHEFFSLQLSAILLSYRPAVISFRALDEFAPLIDSTRIFEEVEYLSAMRSLRDPNSRFVSLYGEYVCETFAQLIENAYDFMYFSNDKFNEFARRQFQIIRLYVERGNSHSRFGVHRCSWLFHANGYILNGINKNTRRILWTYPRELVEKVDFFNGCPCECAARALFKYLGKNVCLKKLSACCFGAARSCGESLANLLIWGLVDGSDVCEFYEKAGTFDTFFKMSEILSKTNEKFNFGKKLREIIAAGGLSARSVAAGEWTAKQCEFHISGLDGVKCLQE